MFDLDVDPAAKLRDLEIWESRERCEASLYQFLREAWPQFDPAPFMDGWHLQAIAEHLEAVSAGEIRRLLINIPPRHCFPADQLIQTEIGALPIGEVVRRRRKLRVPSWSEKRGRIELQPIVGWWENPGADIYRLDFDDGTRVRCTGDHRLLEVGGDWSAACDMPIGTVVPVVRSPESFGRLRPVQALPNVVDVSKADAISRSQNPRGFVAHADFSRLLRSKFSELALEIERRAVGHGVGVVVGLCAVAEIIKSAVRAVPIQVSDLLPGWAWAFEGQHDQLMHGAFGRPCLSFSPQRDQWVAAFANTHAKRLAGTIVNDTILANDQMRSAFDATKVGDFVPGEAWDLAPDFARLVGITHIGFSPSTYCLTVRDNYNFVVGDVRGIIVSNCKTNLTAIAWNAWTWAQEPEPDNPLVGPGVRFLCASYGASKAQQDAVTARRLIGSKWYQERWGTRYSISKDRDNQERFDTSAGGGRISTGIPESLGNGGLIKIVDDPHKTDEVESQAVLDRQVRAYNEVWRTRSNDPQQGAEVVVMQRLGEGDLSGYLLEHDSDVVHLCLPTLYESDRRCVTSIGWADPRQEDGELLWPERFDSAWAEKQKESVGTFAWVGQFQQRPAPRGGGIVKDDWWKLWPPRGEEMKWTNEEGVLHYPQFSFTMAYLDTAFTTKDENAWCALTRWGVFEREGTGCAMLCGAWRERPTLKGLVDKVVQTCRRGRVDVLMIENKAGAEWVKQEIMTLMRSEEWSIVLDEPKGDKVARLHRVTVMFENGLVYAPAKGWADMVISEVSNFPKGRWMDLTDTVSGALGYLRRSDLLRLKREVSEEEDMRLRFRGKKTTIAEEYGA